MHRAVNEREIQTRRLFFDDENSLLDFEFRIILSFELSLLVLSEARMEFGELEEVSILFSLSLSDCEFS